MKEYRVRIKDTAAEWEEKMNVPDGVNPRDYANDIVTRFNETLKPPETRRELVDIIGETGVEYCDVSKVKENTVYGDSR